MRVNVKLLRNCNKPKRQNYTFLGETGLTLVVIDSYQGMARCGKIYNLALDYVQFGLIEHLTVQCYKFLNQTHS